MYQKLLEMFVTYRKELLNREDCFNYKYFSVLVIFGAKEEENDDGTGFWIMLNAVAHDPERGDDGLLVLASTEREDCSIEEFESLLERADDNFVHCESRPTALQCLYYGLVGTDIDNARYLLKDRKERQDWSLGEIAFTITEKSDT